MVYPENKIQLNEDANEMYLECGYILRRDGSEETTLYLVNGRLFEECEEEDSENEDDIEKWGDGKYYKRFLLGSEKKLENENLELESKLKECGKNLAKCGQKEAITVLKHMGTLHGDYSEYMKHADDDDIQSIQTCCDMFRRLKYKTTKRGRENDLMLLEPIRKEFENVMDPDVSIKKKREILSKPQVGQGIFTLLASTVLPALISLFTK